MDGDGDLDLLVGNYNGFISHYKNEGTNQAPNFKLLTRAFNGINLFPLPFGAHVAPRFCDINADGDYDLLVGRSQQAVGQINPGDVYFYENLGTAINPQFQLITQNYLSIDAGEHSQNVSTDVDADNDRDIFIANPYSQRISHYSNLGTEVNPEFIWLTDRYQNIQVGGLRIYFRDIDADQDPDLFIGETILPNPPYPGLYLYQNVGTPQSAVFSLYSNNYLPGNYHVSIFPLLTDINADGDQDLFLSANDGVFYYFQNVGTPQAPSFASPIQNWQGIHVTATAGCFYDIDNDDDQDLFLTLAEGEWNQLRFYRNIGTPSFPQMSFVTDTFLVLPTLSTYMGIDIMDLDNDGDGDILLNTYEGGGVYFFRNVTGQSPVDPRKRPAPTYPTIELTLQPNPGNPVAIVLSLPSPQPATLAVYNLLGAKVATLTSGLQPAGVQRYFWETTPFASGVYLVRLEARKGAYAPGGETITKKLTVIK